MSKGMKKVLSLILAGAFTVSTLTACGSKPAEEPTTTPTEATSPTGEATPTEATDPTEAPTESAGKEEPLVVGTSAMNQKYSEFYNDTAFDMEIVELTQTSMMTTDRMGGIIYNGIEGETVNYNGTDYFYQGTSDLSVEYDKEKDITVYTAKLRDDLKFSDGTPMTADDIIFNYYVYLDPAYIGSVSLSSYNILGAQDYMTQTTSELYDKYAAVVEDIYKAGRKHKWSSEDSFTEEQQKKFWEELDAAWSAHTQVIVDYVQANLASQDYVDEYFPGFKLEDIQTDDGLKVAYAMAMYNYGTMENGVLTAKSKTTFDIQGGTYPTLEDFTKETMKNYKNDPVLYYETESVGNGEPDVFGTAKTTCITTFAAEDPDFGGGVPNVTGVKKLDDYTVEITTSGYEAPAVYTLLNLRIHPLHYYGDPAKYDYENNMFGHDYGDLKGIEAKTTQPLGAGPYKFVEYKDKTAYLEANENYYLGTPKTKYVQFKEVLTNEVAPGIKNGTIDIATLDGTVERFNEVKGYNSNGDITGDVISTSKVDNLGYGYIGINAKNVSVGGEPGSDASKNLRRAFATLLAVYRDTTIDSYYGEAASVIQYPISNTSWAAPQATDEGYQIAFSKDVDGNDIYTSSMSTDEKYAAALQASIAYFKAAGYTFDEAGNKFTAAPDGAKLSYEIMVPADGSGNHPSFAILTDVSAALKTIGIDLKITDLADSSVLWEKIDALSQELWCAAWQATVDPDMYQVYHSNNVVGANGTDSNHYYITDKDLDKYILDARQSDDQAYRKSLYRQALDVIADWAVEVPVYQRQNCIIFSTERVKMDTVTPDITTFYKWYAEIEKLEMNGNAQ